MTNVRPFVPAKKQALEQIPLETGKKANGGTSSNEESLHAMSRPTHKFWRVLSIALAVAAIGGAFLSISTFERLDYFALKRLDMKGDTAKVPLARLKEAVEPAIAGRTFFTANLTEARQAAESVPWVRSASVRRIWPDRIEISVDVHEALALFEDGRLISQDGQLFSANPDEGAESQNLPQFFGAPDEVPELVRRYRRFNTVLQNLPVHISEVGLSDRGGWSITFEGVDIPPTRVELGRETAGSSIEERLRQVIAAYPSIEAILGGPPSSIDARYRGAIAAGKVDREALANHLAGGSSELSSQGANASVESGSGTAKAIGTKMPTTNNTDTAQELSEEEDADALVPTPANKTP